MEALSNLQLLDTVVPQAPAPAIISPSSQHKQNISAATPRSSVDRRPSDLLPTYIVPRRSHHASSVSTSSLPRIVPQRSSGTASSILSRAKDRTQSAFASISEPAVRPRQSSQSLARHSLAASPSPSTTKTFATAGTASPPSKSPSSESLSSGEYTTTTASNPPSQAYVDTDPSHPLPIRQSPRGDPKMHQTSSRLLRMTDDDRPYTRV